MVSIYAIKNPISGKVFYVGATLYPQRRFNEHYYGGTWKKETDRYKIMRELRLKRIVPEMVILAEVEPAKAKQTEQFWIDYYMAIGNKLDQLKTSAYGINKSKQYRAETRKRLNILA